MTIIEGIGAAFLPTEKDTLKVWVECDENTEIERRVARDKKYTKEQIEKRYIERTGQFFANVYSLKKDFDVIINTSKQKR